MTEDTSILLKDKSIGNSWLPEKDTSYYKDLDLEEDNGTKNNVEITDEDEDEDVLDINVFVKLLRLFLYCFHHSL